MKTPPQNHGRRETLAAAVLGLILIPALASGCRTPANAVVKPNTAPSTAQVRDGLGRDMDRQEARTSLFANWDAFVDPEGKPVVYNWSAGTKPGATDVLDWQYVAGARQAAANNLNLPTSTATGGCSAPSQSRASNQPACKMVRGCGTAR